MTNRCASCAFYAPFDSARVGECRVRSPVWHPRAGSDEAGSPGKWDGWWPNVKADEWCGEFKRSASLPEPPAIAPPSPPRPKPAPALRAGGMTGPLLPGWWGWWLLAGLALAAGLIAAGRQSW